jgi:hypothetical protein
VFVPISLGGMISGALGSATEGEGKGIFSGGEGKWAWLFSEPRPK